LQSNDQRAIHAQSVTTDCACIMIIIITPVRSFPSEA